MGFEPRNDHVYAIKSLNARVAPTPARYVATCRTQPRHLVRFGASHAIALVTLELGAPRRLDGWDTEWYEGEVLRRLRACLFADPAYRASFRDDAHRRASGEHFDWLANTYQLESIDLDIVLALGKRRYYELLLAVLGSIYRDEALDGAITAFVLQRYRFSDRDIRIAHG